MSVRSSARSTLGWAFGMSVSILFLALWGRAVVGDTDTLAETLSPLTESSYVIDRVADWMAEEMVESGAEPSIVEPTIEYVIESPGVGETLDQLAFEVVHAAASSDPSGSTIDMATLAHPAVPDLAAGLTELGYPVTESDVSEVVAEFEPLVIRQPGADAIVGPYSPAAARLGTAALLAMIALVIFGFGLVSLSDDRVAAVRSLMTRVAVGGVGFAVLLRLGSWVLDPQGGRAPVRESLSAMAGSKWAVPLQVALVAAVIAAVIYLARRVVRREEGSPPAAGPPTHPPRRPSSLSESR